jgi:hypothetical protein
LTGVAWLTGVSQLDGVLSKDRRIGEMKTKWTDAFGHPFFFSSSFDDRWRTGFDNCWQPGGHVGQIVVVSRDIGMVL